MPPFFKKVSIDYVPQSIVQAASITLQRKKFEYIYVGVIFTTVRIVALRFIKNYKLKNEQNVNENVTAGYLKIINFFIYQSTVYSSLAISSPFFFFLRVTKRKEKEIPFFFLFSDRFVTLWVTKRIHLL